MGKKKINFQVKDDIPDEDRTDFVNSMARIIIKNTNKRDRPNKDKLINIIQKFELGCFVYAYEKENSQRVWYESKKQELFNNLDPSSDAKNINFLSRVLSEENINYIEEFKKPSYSLNPEVTDSIIRDIEEAEKLRYTDFIENSSMYSCRKCKSTKIKIDNKQPRASDEAETIFFMCTKCGSKWRE